VGGVGPVTLGDEEARRRGTQKTVLERKAPPTFDVLVEQESWNRVTIHHDLAAAVDSLLRGHATTAELRERDAEGRVASRLVVVEPMEATAGPAASAPEPSFGYFSREEDELAPAYRGRQGRRHRSAAPWTDDVPVAVAADDELEEATGTLGAASTVSPVTRRRRTMRIYPFGVSRDRIEQSARRLCVPVEISQDQKNADAVIALKEFYRRQPDRLRASESTRTPIYVLKNNTVEQMAEALAHMFDLGQTAPVSGATARGENPRDALLEAEDAINRVLTTGGGQVELAPQNSYVRRMQHQLAERYNLTSRSRGKEPNRRVRIFGR
jgi:hypothetical protein